jgi:hypothetical protein
MWAVCSNGNLSPGQQDIPSICLCYCDLITTSYFRQILLSRVFGVTRRWQNY